MFIISISSILLFVFSIVYYKIREKHTKKKFQELLRKVTLPEEKKKKIASKKKKILDDKAKFFLEKIIDFEKNKTLFISRL